MKSAGGFFGRVEVAVQRTSSSAPEKTQREPKGASGIAIALADDVFTGGVATAMFSTRELQV
jgi:hypothetical protein